VCVYIYIYIYIYIYNTYIHIFMHVLFLRQVITLQSQLTLHARTQLPQELSRGLASMCAPNIRTHHLCFELGRGPQWHLDAQRAGKRRRISHDDCEDGSGDKQFVMQHPSCFFLDILLPLLCDIQKEHTSSQLPGSVTDTFQLVKDLLNKTFDTTKWAKTTSGSGCGAQVGGIPCTSYGDVLEATAQHLTSGMRARPIVEDRAGQVEDAVLLGTLQILTFIVKLQPSVAVNIAAPKKNIAEVPESSIIDYLYNECLFNAPVLGNRTTEGPPKCKMPNTRKATFELLIEIVKACPQAYQQLLSALLVKHRSRETRPLHFFQPSQMEKSSCGFVGLHNLGATCYMNSLLQQLYHIPEFRASILQVPVDRTCKEDDDLMYQLQSLFAYLQESEKQYYETRDLCKAYRDCDGQPVNTSQQMDVDEYFNMLFEKLEKGIQGTKQEKLLQDCFGGKVVNQIICKETVRIGDRVYDASEPFKSQREETFYTLQLEVKHKRNILESLDLFVEGEMLEGDNKYFCEEADQKVNALKRLCISKLPKSLILHLKRFEFDFDFMKKVKVNDSCEFPTMLDMDPYTLDGIERREKAAAEAVKKGMDPARAVEQVQSAEGCLYELVGVLVHTGTADSGHYYSYIKDKGGWQDEGERRIRSQYEGKWYLFNDTVVEKFDDREIGNACYGGSECLQSTDGEQRNEYVPRMYNAYMLFYERVSVKGRDSRVHAPVPDEILQRVWSENIQFMKDKQVYDSAYFTFLHQVSLFYSPTYTYTCMHMYL
jgi:ubiquitin carboxyl-terminal hydrolase 34